MTPGTGTTPEPATELYMAANEYDILILTLIIIQLLAWMLYLCYTMVKD